MTHVLVHTWIGKRGDKSHSDATFRYWCQHNEKNIEVHRPHDAAVLEQPSNYYETPAQTSARNHARRSSGNETGMFEPGTLYTHGRR